MNELVKIENNEIVVNESTVEQIIKKKKMKEEMDLKEKEFNITHLTFFNAGSNGKFGGEETRNLYNKRKEYCQ